jgi:hypothetical protein
MWKNFRKKTGPHNMGTLLHYALLAGVVFLAHYLSVNSFFDLEKLTQTNPTIGWSLLFIWYTAFLFVGDEMISLIIRD